MKILKEFAAPLYRFLVLLPPLQGVVSLRLRIYLFLELRRSPGAGVLAD